MTVMLDRPRWVSPAPRPRRGGVLLRLAPGIYIVRSRIWTSSTALDHHGDLPAFDAPDLVRRRYPHPHWHQAAACRTADQAVFFGAPGRRVVLARALTWCGPCAVRAVCLAHALLISEESGVWGGISARELVHLREGLKRGIALVALVAAAAEVTWSEAEVAVAEATGARR